MSLDRKFDYEMKKKLEKQGVEFRSDKYDWYMEESYFKNEFLGKMSELDKLNFSEGDGNEISLNGKYPPKMSSAGSSSNFAYRTFKKYSNGKGTMTTDVFSGEVEEYNNITFEKKLHFGYNRPSNMDVYLESKNNTFVFIEVKSREIYSKYDFILSSKYKEIVEKIFTKEEYIFLEDGKIEILKDYNIYKTKSGKTHYYLKQLFTHLLGISTFIDESDSHEMKIIFANLVFDPKEFENQELNNVFDKSTKKISDVVHELFNQIRSSHSKDDKDITFIYKDLTQYDIEN